MKVEQIDNRRIRRARLTFQKLVHEGKDYDAIRQASMKFSYSLDRQSARVARRIGWDSFAGVPCHFGNHEFSHRHGPNKLVLRKHID